MSRRPFQAIRSWLESFASARGWFDRASIFRHVALCAAAVVAYLMRFDLAGGNEVLWIIGVVALLNLVSFLLAGHPAVGSAARVLSPVIGIGGWTALVHWTGPLFVPDSVGERAVCLDLS